MNRTYLTIISVVVLALVSLWFVFHEGGVGSPIIIEGETAFEQVAIDLFLDGHNKGSFDEHYQEQFVSYYKDLHNTEPPEQTLVRPTITRVAFRYHESYGGIDAYNAPEPARGPGKRVELDVEYEEKEWNGRSQPVLILQYGDDYGGNTLSVSDVSEWEFAGMYGNKAFYRKIR